MKLLFDFFPVLLFFIAFKLSGIYAATLTAIIASFFQVVFYYIAHKQCEKMHLITFFLLVFLGGATLLFHDPVFIKWKPTLIYWVTGLLFIGSQFVGKKPLIKRMMEKNLSITSFAWKRLNLSWGLFFCVMGFLNLFIAYNYDTNTWVNFKLFGGLGLTLLFVLMQSVFLSKHIIEPKQSSIEKG